MDGRSKKRPGVNQQKQSIIDAGVVLFSAHGIAQVSLSQICSAAGVSRPTFYRCYSDKDELLEAIYQQAVNGPVQNIMLSGLFAKKQGKLALLHAVRGMLDAIFEQRSLALFILAEASNVHSPVFNTIDEALEQSVAEMAEWLNTQTEAEASLVTLKALVIACQWLTFDALKKSLDASADDIAFHKEQAVNSIVELSSALFKQLFS